jgi:drug/metabolite transporter (DMT)-like permease
VTNLLLYAGSVLIWGSTWFAITFQLGEVAPTVSLVYRYALAAALLFLWCAARGRTLRFDLATHRYFIALGILLFGINYLCTYHAQLYITSALNAIAFSSLVWLNILNSRIFLGTRVEWRTYAGALLGVAGIVTLFWPEVRELSFSDKTLLGASFSLFGALTASFGNIVSQRGQSRGIPVLQANAWGMLYGAILSGLFALAEGTPFAFERSWSYVASLVYLAVFGSIVAFGCYLTLIGRIGAHRAGYSVVMFPVVALCLSAAFEGLEIDRHIVLGVVLALAGNVVILSAAGSKPPSASAPAPAASPAIASAKKSRVAV